MVLNLSPYAFYIGNKPVYWYGFYGNFFCSTIIYIQWVKREDLMKTLY